MTSHANYNTGHMSKVTSNDMPIKSNRLINGS